jgi:DNA/RNA endonuclease YhcR with UshA esterase domain
MTPVLLALAIVLPQRTVTADEAKTLVGKDAKVCGTVKSARYASRSSRKPTFLNFDKPYPDQVFTVVIFEEDRAKFDKPEEKFRDKDICVTGKVQEFRGTPEIVATDPKQITEWKK